MVFLDVFLWISYESSMDLLGNPHGTPTPSSHLATPIGLDIHLITPGTAARHSFGAFGVGEKMERPTKMIGVI